MWVFLLSSVVFYNSVLFFIRKRLTVGEIYTTVMFALFMVMLSDVYASFEFHLWGFFAKEKSEIESLWITLGIYPATTVLIINWYPYASRWWKKSLYLLAWSVYSTGYEGLALWFGIIWHSNGWNLWYSFLLYPVIYYMLIVQLYIYRWLIGHSQSY